MGRVFSDDDFVDDAPAQRFDMRTGQVPSFDPMDAAIKRRAAEQAQPQITRTQAGALGAGQGASFGFADELTGLAAAPIEGTRPGRWIGEKLGLLSRDFEGNLRSGGDARILERADGSTGPNLTGMITGQQPDASMLSSYRGARDSAREDLEAARDQHAGITYGAEIGASLLNPIRAPIPRGGNAATRILSGGSQGLLQGGAYAAGSSNADLTEGDVGGFLKDTGSGAALGGALGVAGSTVGEGIKAGGKHIAKNLKKRVVNEFAEGLESKTTPTQQQHLNRAQEDIYREVSTGPDAKAVRGTVFKGAAEGRETLKPIVDKVGAANKANYAQFAKAGRDKVDIADYMQRLAAKADEADQAGDTELFEAINSHIDEVDKAYQRTGDMALTRLRGMTTKVQKHAASAVGGLNTHAAAELEGRLMATATEAMDDTLSIAAQGVPELEAAAQSIRTNNRRIYALKTVDKGLQLRESKEGNAPGLLVRGAKAAATPGALAAGAAIAGDDESRLENAVYGGLAGAGVRGLVPLAKLAQRGITSAGIKTQLPGYGGPSSGAVARGVRPFVPPISLDILDALMKRREQERK